MTLAIMPSRQSAPTRKVSEFPAAAVNTFFHGRIGTNFDDSEPIKQDRKKSDVKGKNALRNSSSGNEGTHSKFVMGAVFF